MSHGLSFVSQLLALHWPSSKLTNSIMLHVIYLLTLIGLTYGAAPNIVFFLGDDIGWNDVGWHNDKMVTPMLDQLAKEGIILDDYYTHAICTPSRTSLMTGYYAQTIGLQRGVIHNQEPTGLPLRYKILPEKLKEAGYATHAIGKWHLGFCNQSYTPTSRGFDTFLGFYTGGEENYLHCVGNSLAITKDTCLGLDFRDNEKSAPQYTGEFGTDVFTKRAIEIIQSHDKDTPLFMYISMTNMHFPVQAPERFADRCTKNKNPARKNFCAAMAAYDEAVKNITKTIKKSGLYDNTVLIFASDNGAWTMFGGNNYPLRGEKSTLWEGGMRVPSFIHSPLLKKHKHVHRGLFHVSDWYPTILSIARITTDSDLDGVDQWKAIIKNQDSPRREIIHSIDVKEKTLIGAIRLGDYKLITGPPGETNAIVTEEKTIDLSLDIVGAGVIRSKFLSNQVNKSDDFVRLFNLKNDPTESHNLADKMPKKAEILLSRLQAAARKAKPAWKGNVRDPAGDPTIRGGVYETGWCQAVYDVPTISNIT